MFVICLPTLVFLKDNVKITHSSHGTKICIRFFYFSTLILRNRPVHSYCEFKLYIDCLLIEVYCTCYLVQCIS